MLLLRNGNDPKLNEANFHERLRRSKQLLKNIHSMMLASFSFTDVVVKYTYSGDTEKPAECPTVYE